MARKISFQREFQESLAKVGNEKGRFSVRVIESQPQHADWRLVVKLLSLFIVTYAELHRSVMYRCY